MYGSICRGLTEACTSFPDQKFSTSVSACFMESAVPMQNLLDFNGYGVSDSLAVNSLNSISLEVQLW